MEDDRNDDGLLDVSGLDARDLEALVDESALGRALDSILAAQQDNVGYHGFNSRI
jgi:hypothetical protein